MAGLDDLFVSDSHERHRQQARRRRRRGEQRDPQRWCRCSSAACKQNAQDPEHASKIESAADNHAASGLLDGGVSVDQVDEADGLQAVAKIFGGNDTGQVAGALAGGGGGNSDLIKQLLPILAPIVLAYIGKQLSQRSRRRLKAAGAVRWRRLGDILGSILGGASAVRRRKQPARQHPRQCAGLAARAAAATSSAACSAARSSRCAPGASGVGAFASARGGS